MADHTELAKRADTRRPGVVRVVSLRIEGMSCTSCAAAVQRALAAVPDVQAAAVSFSGRKAVVEVAANVPGERLQKAVEAAGYRVVSPTDGEAENRLLRAELRRLTVAWLLTLPLMTYMVLHMGFGRLHGWQPFMRWVEPAVAFVVVFVVGFPVIRATVRSFWTRVFVMDALIGIGTVAAFASGVLQLFGVEVQSFAAVGAMIMAINFVGNALKLRATGRASTAIRHLLELGAKKAWRQVTIDGSPAGGADEFVEVDAAELVVGDIVRVLPGEKVPADGCVVDGRSSVDESIATGESVPVDKAPGDSLLGSTVNHTGRLLVRVEKTGDDTFLANIVDLVQRAQASRVPVQELADRVTAVFVPIILVLSVVTFAAWALFPEVGRALLSWAADVVPWIDTGMSPFSQALYAAIAVLVIACPCALGLATPTALMVGMGHGAERGILIRNGEALQTARSIDTVVFDKTGTLTEGRPAVDAVILVDRDWDFATFQRVVAAVERRSEHPLARAVVDHIDRPPADRAAGFPEPEYRGPDGPTGGEPAVVDFLVVPGSGARATLVDVPAQGTVEIVVGSLRYLAETGVAIDYAAPLGATGTIGDLLESGHTLVGVSSQRTDRPARLVGIIALSDTIKPDAAAAVARLRRMGLRCVMLTGDNRRAAAVVAQAVGIDDVEAELLPGQKIDVIERLQARGEVVAMVGDGLNDAPALKRADVGIAVGTGTDVAIEAADITLVSTHLSAVADAVELSRSTFATIRGNLFWAFLYNVIAIPAAAAGLLHPLVAELAMAFSSISVVGNSLRLRSQLAKRLRWPNDR